MGLRQWAVVKRKDRRGIQWPGLLPMLFRDYRGTKPQLLLIDLGGNDLGLIRGKALVVQVIEDWKMIKA